MENGLRNLGCLLLAAFLVCGLSTPARACCDPECTKECDECLSPPDCDDVPEKCGSCKTCCDGYCEGAGDEIIDFDWTTPSIINGFTGTGIEIGNTRCCPEGNMPRTETIVVYCADADLAIPNCPNAEERACGNLKSCSAQCNKGTTVTFTFTTVGKAGDEGRFTLTADFYRCDGDTFEKLETSWTRTITVTPYPGDCCLNPPDGPPPQRPPAGRI